MGKLGVKKKLWESVRNNKDLLYWGILIIW